jgi:hypothetical protein
LHLYRPWILVLIPTQTQTHLRYLVQGRWVGVGVADVLGTAVIVTGSRTDQTYIR